MRIVISPAKKMRVDTDSFLCQNQPVFLEETKYLLSRLKAMSYEELKALWNCNDQLAQLNAVRLQNMDLTRNLTPAILAYEGIQYQYMAPGLFTAEELDYVEGHLRILSGFYGVLRPFDGVTPYRLEMQAKLKTERGADLYHYWGTRLADWIWGETDCVVNLASKEYSRCLSKGIPAGKQWITCVFGERKGSRIVEKGTMCKMARGEMVRYMAEHQVQAPEEIQAFDRLSYRFSPEASDAQTYVFMKEEATSC